MKPFISLDLAAGKTEGDGAILCQPQLHNFTQLRFDARVAFGLLSTLAQLPELGIGEWHLEPGRHSGQEQDSWKELPLRLTGKKDGCENGEVQVSPCGDVDRELTSLLPAARPQAQQVGPRRCRLDAPGSDSYPRLRHLRRDLVLSLRRNEHL